jgi:hypothetical protein
MYAACLAILILFDMIIFGDRLQKNMFTNYEISLCVLIHYNMMQDTEQVTTEKLCCMTSGFSDNIVAYHQVLQILLI